MGLESSLWFEKQVDLVSNLIENSVVGQQLLGFLAKIAKSILCPTFEFFVIWHQQGSQPFSVLADQNRILDEWEHGNSAFYPGGIDVLAAGQDDNVFGPAGDHQLVVDGQLAEIPRLEIAIFSE